MKQIGILQAKGFEVLHNSQGWRIAEHAYQPDVNGIPAFLTWGRHLDSEEAFLLLSGEGYLVTSKAGKDYHITPLKKGEICLVETGERHAILLSEDGRALIVENQDMSNSVTEPIDDELRKEILELLRKGI